MAVDDDPLPAKKILGQTMGGAVRFAKASEKLAIAQGIETALSVLQAFPDMPVWAVLLLDASVFASSPDRPSLFALFWP